MAGFSISFQGALHQWLEQKKSSKHCPVLACRQMWLQLLGKRNATLKIFLQQTTRGDWTDTFENEGRGVRCRGRSISVDVSKLELKAPIQCWACARFLIEYSRENITSNVFTFIWFLTSFSFTQLFILEASLCVVCYSSVQRLLIICPFQILSPVLYTFVHVFVNGRMCACVIKLYLSSLFL